jgi:adenine-specific DNA-methyltransferase
MTAEEGTKTFGTIRSAFRKWAETLPSLPAPAVAGGSPEELQLLAALGALAAEIGRDHLDRWPEACRGWALAAPSAPVELVEEVGLELGADADVLAALYNSCISGKSRRRLGTVFTPQPVVDHMVELVAHGLDGEPGVVLDPGAGVGAFSISAARRWPSATTIAVDVNPVTLGLLATRLAFEADADLERAEIYQNIELRMGNYLELFADVYATAEKPVAALGNPPYTRIQQMPQEERRRAMELAAPIIDSGHANLAILIQAMTVGKMRPEDVSCMILPGSLSFTRAGLGLRRELWRSNRQVTVERWPAAQRLFIGHSVQAAIVSIGQSGPCPTPLQLSTVELEHGVVQRSEEWNVPRPGREPKDWFVAEVEPANEGAVPLASLARIRRGVATGANQMFFLDDRTAALFPPEVCVAGIQSLRGFEGDCLDLEAHRDLDRTGARRWLLAIPQDKQLGGELARYVERFETDVKNRFLPSQRPVWYSLSLPSPPPLLIAPLSKGIFRIVTNLVGAIPSNNLFGIYPVREAELPRIASWLRSDAGQVELRRVSRRYPGGSYKLEPGDLGSARIPAAA